MREVELCVGEYCYYIRWIIQFIKIIVNNLFNRGLFNILPEASLKITM